MKKEQGRLRWIAACCFQISYRNLFTGKGFQPENTYTLEVHEGRNP